jgi:hypothetical protein
LFALVLAQKFIWRANLASDDREQASMCGLRMAGACDRCKKRNSGHCCTWAQRLENTVIPDAETGALAR